MNKINVNLYGGKSLFRRRRFIHLTATGGTKMNKYIFPVILIAIDICAAAVYGINGDLRKTIYWIAAAVLNAAVTF